MKLLKVILVTLFFLPFSFSSAWGQTDAALTNGDSVSASTRDSLAADAKQKEEIKKLEDRINRAYFKDARAKNYAIAAARYGEEAYFYAKDIHQGYNLNFNYAKQARANADTSYWFVKKALLLSDSAMRTASDSSVRGKDYMRRAIKHFQNAKQYLEWLYGATDAPTTRYHGQRAMFETSNGLTDAFHASLFFGDGEVDEEEPLYTSVTRLEADQAAFNALAFNYEDRLKRIEEQLEELKKKLDGITDAGERRKVEGLIGDLEREKTLIESKLGNLREQLTEIDGALALQNSLGGGGGAGGSGDGSGSGSGGGGGGGGGPLDIPEGKEDLSDLRYELDKELPPGLVYRVQIGYYPLRSRPDFDDVGDVDARVSTNRYIRYFTGIYRTYDDATAAKDSIRGKHVTDAFLVSFNDGAKIPVYNALTLEFEKNALEEEAREKAEEETREKAEGSEGTKPEENPEEEDQ